VPVRKCLTLVKKGKGKNGETFNKIGGFPANHVNANTCIQKVNHSRSTGGVLSYNAKSTRPRPGEPTPTARVSALFVLVFLADNSQMRFNAEQNDKKFKCNPHE